MPKGYSRELTTVHRLHYHFIWCPKYRKSVLKDDIRERLIALIRNKADELELEIMNLAVEPDHVHLFIEGHPKLPPNKIIQQIKGYTSHELREDFDFGLPTLWTRSYFVSSTGQVSDEIVDQYIEEQSDV
jgi:putative transposase